MALTVPSGVFVAAVRRVGGTALDPDVIAQLLARKAGDPIDLLSRRELEVLGLIAEG